MPTPVFEALYETSAILDKEICSLSLYHLLYKSPQPLQISLSNLIKSVIKFPGDQEYST